MLRNSIDRRAEEAAEDRPFLVIMHAETPLEATRRFLDQIQKLDDLAHRRVQGLATDLRKEIIGRMGSARNWEAYRLPRLLGDLNRTMDDWQTKQLGLGSDFIYQYEALGQAQVAGPLQAAGVDLGLPRTSIKVLEVSQRFSADLIKEITDQTRSSINREVMLTTNGVNTPFQAMQKIESMIDDPLTFRSIAARAETILKTEGGRVQSIAAQGRLEDAARVVPGLQKQWLWSGNARVQHQLIDKQVRDVDKPFDVPAYGRCPSDKLMFPRDPSGLACQTINCGCQSVPYKKEWELEKLAA